MRKVARENVFKLIFEYTFYNVINETTLELMLLDSDLDEDDKEYIERLYREIAEKKDELDALISENLSGYTIERLYRPDYVALLVAAYELKYDVAPVAVVINEAVSIAKKYGTLKSGAFVNGVLAKIAKSLQ